MRTFCPTCGDDTIPTRDGLCSVCDTRVLSNTKLRRTSRRAVRSDSGTPDFCDPELVERAYHDWYIGQRLSVRRTADLVLQQPGVYYASRESCARMLDRQWKRRGLPVRDRTAATIEQQWTAGGIARRALRSSPEYLERRRQQKLARGETRGVKCAATTARGTPCARHALRNSAYCIAHDPERSATVTARLADARTRSPRGKTTT